MADLRPPLTAPRLVRIHVELELLKRSPVRRPTVVGLGDQVGLLDSLGPGQVDALALLVPVDVEVLDFPALRRCHTRSDEGFHRTGVRLGGLRDFWARTRVPDHRRWGKWGQGRARMGGQVDFQDRAEVLVLLGDVVRNAVPRDPVFRHGGGAMKFCQS